MNKVYKIWCEWDMGKNWDSRVFSTKKKAQEEINSADWEGLVDVSLEEVEADQMVGIEEEDLDS